MLDPVGPHPPSVYWRRRAVALGAFVLVLLLGVWAVGLAFGGSEDTERELAELRAAAAARSLAATGTSTPGSPSALPPPSNPGPPPDQPPPPPPPPPPPGPPQPCPNQVTKVTAEVGAPEYRVGQRPEFRLVVTNTGPVPCTRELDPRVQEILVFGLDGARLWSSNDCYPGRNPDLRTLEPGGTAVFRLAWHGRTSAPTCAGKRKTVLAGEYTVVAKVDDLASPPAPFRLR
ncbi:MULTISPECIES: DUF4232 domain-containing protein [unclassified Crossiella]|uniref:DUF4232 domain-containing protein n=1 Tax=unclassified Crossiella TaxID=2620835 RepID=UPI001FFE88E4|nr:MULTISPECIES: DUF4232 domain-containing protein [unclassified Crossiella]MCK2237802.1 DUF4232 domain-containing protein [Crossiella sp. S99.2]MCK2255088.1 DUF4232 domain-containing protein [Crossiella sp. S99.1]